MRFIILCTFLWAIGVLSAPLERRCALEPGLEARASGMPGPNGLRCWWGYKARSRGRKVSLDGCSVPHSRFNIPRFKACCNKHDLCYGNCAKEKKACDREWLSCMRNTCGWDFNCLASAQGYYAAVRLAGNGAFRDATKKYCTCHKA